MLFSTPAIGSPDSTSVKKSSSYDRWFLAEDPEWRFSIDTSIFNIEEYNHCQRDGIEYAHLGNLGSPAYPIVFQQPVSKGFSEGMNAFDVYRFKPDSIRYYHVKRPYTQIMYVIGLGNEQRFNGRFANRYKEIIYYGVEYDRLYSKGAYPNQQSNHNGFSLYALFHSPDRHWDAKTNLLFNDFQMGENGGLAYDIFSADSTPLSSSLSQVNLTAGKNRYNEITFQFSGNYNFLQSAVQAIDSLIQQPMPLFRLGIEAACKRNKYRFSDLAPDSLYYQSFLTNPPDSASFQLQTLSVSGRIFFEYTGYRRNAQSSKPRNIVAGVSSGLSWIRVNDLGRQQDYFNTDIQAYIRSNTLSKSRWSYRADAFLFLTGYNQLDWSVSGRGAYDLGRAGSLSISGKHSAQENSLIYRRFRNPGTEWDNNHGKMKTTEATLGWVSTQWHLQASISYYLLQNTPYFSTPSTPSVERSLIHVGVAHLAHRLSVKGFHLDNDFFFQLANSSRVIRLPWFVSRHSIYYDVRLFKKALWLSTGFDLRYQTAFQANGYFPLTGQFYLQDQRVFSYYPILDYFLNFKVRTVRISLKVDNISGLFGPKGYYNAALYPSRSLSFRAGIIWRFFE